LKIVFNLLDICLRFFAPVGYSTSKMGYCDEILRANNESEHRHFIGKLQAARDDIVAFVNLLLG